MNVRTFVLCLFWPCAASAQGFAGLGTDAEGFAVPRPAPQFDFPADHAAHPDYRIEWWYLTANLTGPDGTPYGLQWTLFRSALAPQAGAGWTAPQLWMGHAAVTTPEDHYVTERLARGGIGQAGAAEDEAWIDNWRLAGDWTGAMTLQADAENFAYRLDMEATGPLVFQGEGGYSVKSAAGQASYYYSQPFLEVAGELMIAGESIPVTGTGWIDREWSSQPLAEDQTGWDWFSLSFDTGDKMMGFLLRQTDGTAYTSATWITAEGETTPYPDGAFTAEPLAQSETAGATVPTRWQVRLPDRGVDVTVGAINPDAWMTTSVPYWEGPVTVTGTHEGQGYLEMTGYE